MEENKVPTLNKTQLLRSVFIAALIGALVLVTAVLPAEYNIDPLGTGKLFGFSRLYAPDTREATSEIDVPLATGINYKPLRIEKLGSPPSVARPAEANAAPPTAQFVLRRDTIKVSVPAGKGIEYKFKALKYAAVKYDWNTSDNAVVYIDFHGEVQQDNPPENVFYESYTLAYSNNMAGTFTAPFEGRHGWYFRNETREDVTVTLRLNGQYELLEK